MKTVYDLPGFDPDIVEYVKEIGVEKVQINEVILLQLCRRISSLSEKVTKLTRTLEKK